MKRLLLPLIAAVALPTAVNAENTWLVIQNWRCARGCGVALEKIEMNSMSQCQEQGEIYKSSSYNSLFVCIKGK